MKKSLKTLSVVLIVIIVCGGLLAILSDLLKVDDNERIQRAINSIYTNEKVSLNKSVDVASIDTSALDEKGDIKACYKLDNGDYLVLSKGKKGYSNGTVTIYVAISVDKEIKVKNTVIDSYSGQTLMSKLTDLYSRFTGKTSSDSYKDVIEIATGASKSSEATSNAVYISLQFVSLVEGGQNG